MMRGYRQLGAIVAAIALFGAGASAARTVEKDRGNPIIPGDTPRARAAPLTMRKIILVGDSTVAPVSGWGGAFCAYHVAAHVACVNLARGGRSSRSYREEGSWDAALAEMAVPGYAATYVLIQFGHNDQNHGMKVWTDIDTEYPENLRQFVREARSRGAIPVLVTPMVRRLFKDGTLDNILAAWAGKMLAVANEMQVPVVDLNHASATLVSALGPNGASSLAQLHPGEKLLTPPITTEEAGPRYHFELRDDPTHLGDSGARKIAVIVAHNLAIAVPELSRVIAP
jgi:lysophospholipase L1-like esterase